MTSALHKVHDLKHLIKNITVTLSHFKTRRALIPPPKRKKNKKPQLEKWKIDLELDPDEM